MLFNNINIPSLQGYTCINKFFDERFVGQTHWHGFIEIEIVLSGTGIHQYDNTEHVITKGDAWLISSLDSHYAICEKGLNIVNIAITPDVLHKEFRNYLNSFHPLCCHFDDEELESIRQRLDILFKEQDNSYTLSNVKAYSIINELAVDIARKSPVDEIHSSPTVIQKVTKYISKNFTENLSITQLAELFDLTPNYLGHLFKNATGLTFTDYLNSLRLRNACYLLITSDETVKKIAIDSGFNSVEYFTSTFKKYYGASPSQYRKLSTIQNSVQTLRTF